MKESQIEAGLVRAVKQRGGLCFKWVSPGNNGVPDRIVITPKGRVIFAELKTNTGRLSQIQVLQQGLLRSRRAEVVTLYGMQDVEAFVAVVFPEEEVTPK